MYDTIVINKISTHTLRKEGDLCVRRNIYIAALISTHTLRKEGDGLDVPPTVIYQNFNPHPPQGG